MRKLVLAAIVGAVIGASLPAALLAFYEYSHQLAGFECIVLWPSSIMLFSETMTETESHDVFIYSALINTFWYAIIGTCIGGVMKFRNRKVKHAV